VATASLLAAPPANDISAGLIVTPGTGLQASGLSAGPFTPSSMVYLLSNATEEPLAWALGKDQSWLSVSAAQGVLAGGESVSVTVFLNSRVLRLPLGDQIATLTITNLTTGTPVASREARVSVLLAGPATVEPISVPTAQLQIRLTGQPGTVFVIESSNDLLEWHGILTNIFFSPSGVYMVPSENARQRFYRAASRGPNAQPAFLTLSYSFIYTQDSSKLRLSGDAAGTYLVESSVDQIHWTPIYTNKLTVSGTVVFSNQPPPATAVYRATAIAAPSNAPVHHVLIVGQSLALGVEGAPALSTTPSDRHLRFYSDESGDYLLPLQELALETIASSSANQVSGTAPLYRLVLSNTGLGGAGYDMLKKGTANYTLTLGQIRHAPQALAYQLAGYWPGAIFAVHGETDQLNPDYDLNIREWQANLEADIQNLTGFADGVPMFHTQISAWSSSLLPHVLSPYKVLAESELNPSKTILVGPKYFLPYALPVGLHLNNQGYRWLGEYYGKVYRKVVVEGAPWTPLKPHQIVRTGAVVTATFDVPVPPLVLDTNMVSDPGNYGFEYFDESDSPPTITGVELLDDRTVQITLSSVPSGNNPRLRYAYTAIPGNPGGPTTGPRGNLHDSDSEVSPYSDTLYNWCVHFDKPIQ
jgi:hypothetical protein